MKTNCFPIDLCHHKVPDGDWGNLSKELARNILIEKHHHQRVLLHRSELIGETFQRSPCSSLQVLSQRDHAHVHAADACTCALSDGDDVHAMVS